MTCLLSTVRPPTNTFTILPKNNRNSISSTWYDQNERDKNFCTNLSITSQGQNERICMPTYTNKLPIADRVSITPCNSTPPPPPKKRNNRACINSNGWLGRPLTISADFFTHLNIARAVFFWREGSKSLFYCDLKCHHTQICSPPISRFGTAGSNPRKYKAEVGGTANTVMILIRLSY